MGDSALPGIASAITLLIFPKCMVFPVTKEICEGKRKKKKERWIQLSTIQSCLKKKKRKILKYCNYCDRTDVIQKGLLTDTLKVNRIFSKVY